MFLKMIFAQGYKIVEDADTNCAPIGTTAECEKAARQLGLCNPSCNKREYDYQKGQWTMKKYTSVTDWVTKGYLPPMKAELDVREGSPSSHYPPYCYLSGLDTNYEQLLKFNKDGRNTGSCATETKYNAWEQSYKRCICCHKNAAGEFVSGSGEFHIHLKETGPN